MNPSQRWLLAALLLLAAIGAGALLWRRARATAPSAPARTLYEGSVGVAPVDLAELEASLEAKGCRRLAQRAAGCLYERREAQGDRPPGIFVHPRGLGFGPEGFLVTRDRLYAVRDLWGEPDEEAYRQAIREDVRALDGIVRIDERGWALTRVTHPWSVVY